MDCLARRFCQREHIKIADRFEPFAKFVLKLLFPTRYATLATTLRHRFTLAEILKELDLAEESELKAWSRCDWQQFPPVGLPGTPGFKEQVGWTYRFRNTEEHLAPVLDDKQEAELVQSVCVCLVWLTAKYEREIRAALTKARFASYLERLRSRFAGTGTSFVELTAEKRVAEESRWLPPRTPVLGGGSEGETTAVSKLPEGDRVTVIEAGPGAGKTWTLEFLAWQAADGMLAGRTGCSHVPVYLELKLLAHRGQTIAVGVWEELRPASPDAESLPWDSLLLLVDGLNEVEPQAQSRFKAELKDLLARHPQTRAIITGRPNSFQTEFPARIVVLKRLTVPQLKELFSKELGDETKASLALEALVGSPFLLSWAFTPLHAWLITRVAKQGDLPVLSSGAAIIRSCIRSLLGREKAQASADVTRTGLETKEPLLARLGFETKLAGESAFSRNSARRLLADAQAEMKAASLDVPRFVEELLDNHLLTHADSETLAFAHELYHDYFAATELETRERSRPGLGAEFALARFANPSWTECIRLFAGFTKSSRRLIEHGAEQNPVLAYVLLADANMEEAQLRKTVALAAYSVFEGDLRDHGKAEAAAGCMPVLAVLGRADLVEQAILRQRQILGKSELWKLERTQRIAEKQRIQEAMVPLGLALIWVLRLGIAEQRAGREGECCEASRAAIRALKQIKAARVLVRILACWPGKSFDAASLIPGALIEALLEMGVDEVLNNRIESDKTVLAEWLCRASEAGSAKAWPAYGRVLRLGSLRPVPGIVHEPRSLLKWLRQSHELGDVNGSLELALLLIDEPDLSNEAGEGERLLRQLAPTQLEARYELGLGLLKGDGLPKCEAAGLEQLISAAEAGHPLALSEINPCLFCEGGPPLPLSLPAWAKPYRSRLVALFPGLPLDLV